MRKSKIVLVLVMVLLLVSCAGLQEQWNKLTPDERARVIVGGIQSEIDGLWSTGKSFVAVNPSFEATWKEKCVPAFDTANRALGAYMTMASQGKISGEDIITNMKPLLQSVKDLLISIGAIKKGV